MTEYHLVESLPQVPEISLTWPILIAVRDKEIVGFMGRYDAEGIFTVTLWAKSSFVGFNLADKYDKFLQAIGTPKYYFWVDKENKWLKAARKLPIYEEFAETEHQIWFERKWEQAQQQ